VATAAGVELFQESASSAIYGWLVPHPRPLGYCLAPGLVRDRAAAPVEPQKNDPHVPPPTPALAVLAVWAAVTIAPRIASSERWNRLLAGLHVACRLPWIVAGELWSR
jgi:hypothetical protein